MVTTAALIIGFSGACFAKERVTHGLLGIFIPVFSIYGACRLAKPKSLWAKKFYGEKRPDKQRRSEIRYADPKSRLLKNRFRDLIGGKTNAMLGNEGRGPEKVSESANERERGGGE